MIQKNHNQITTIGTNDILTQEEAKSNALAALPQEAGAFIKRVGNTNYRIGVYFSTTSEETARDKIMRLVKAEQAANP